MILPPLVFPESTVPIKVHLHVTFSSSFLQPLSLSHENALQWNARTHCVYRIRQQKRNAKSDSQISRVNRPLQL
jgi:hypothetical protein